MFQPGGTRRDFLKTATIASAAAALHPASMHGMEGVAAPNVLYLHSHDSGRYLRPYGHNVPTPNLMRIASRGILFRQMHCAAPSCSPSRAALLTGQSSHASGMNGLAHLGWKLNDYRQHMLHTLRAEKNYHTVLAGLQHIAKDPAVIGFDEILPGTHRLAADVAMHTVDFLNHAPKQPFFLDCGFFETHRDYPQPTDDPNYIQPPSPIPDTPASRNDMAGFHQSARNMDQAIGRILDALERNGLRENTLIISTTDHGIAFPTMKANLTDAGTGVSFIMSGPGEFARPGVCDALLSHVDVFPTLCDYLGFKKPGWLTGTSFLPVVRGEKDEVNDAIFAEITYHAAYEPKRSVRTARYKYQRRFDGRSTYVLTNCDDGPAKSYWVQHGWQRQQLLHTESLYDLVFDPAERNDLARDPAHAEELGKMRGRLDEWMHATNDPLLKGTVALPPGGRSASVDGISPKGDTGPKGEG